MWRGWISEAQLWGSSGFGDSDTEARFGRLKHGGPGAWGTRPPWTPSEEGMMECEVCDALSTLCPALLSGRGLVGQTLDSSMFGP